MANGNNSKFKVESNIEMPSKRADRVKYPFRQMKIGDSFLIEETSDLEKVRSAASYFGNRNEGFSFSIRKTDAGYRCWRTE